MQTNSRIKGYGEPDLRVQGQQSCHGKDIKIDILGGSTMNKKALRRLKFITKAVKTSAIILTCILAMSILGLVGNLEMDVITCSQAAKSAVILYAVLIVAVAIIHATSNALYNISRMEKRHKRKNHSENQKLSA